ncbi:GGDEF domain-containing protein [Pseudocitrobacter faecalis]|nr:GGDEF domain-containing protein [Pseudocitrobacter faecalis]
MRLPVVTRVISSELIQKHELRYTTVLLFDCNKFKAINDAWGHSVGDRALKVIAQCMLDNVRARS